MTIQVNLDEAANRLEQLIDQAAAGEEIIIAPDDRPMVQLVAIQRDETDQRATSWAPS